ncbi:hypothetical protein F9643_003181 [Escherichia coli]|uniref:hypothetical protein n=1 Tax=Escherichia coli TaxID=562 RepID=UPI000BDE9924|nr:hypothetical protein [Escherichia coli]EER0916657.1 hypothetical protein [Escherichia coli O168:H8]EES8553747.1 hypothetical protein [Escherichia coli O168]EER0947428.1 hypothetical protein [Escherichia coli O168:H8]EER2485425.1 hypothetical protein [Escherichia coli]EER2541218.1 hypothetical protein [Escherichia coli]
MTNREARLLLTRLMPMAAISLWVRVSNRRIVQLTISGRFRVGYQSKRSAAQNRWKNHVRYN